MVEDLRDPPPRPRRRSPLYGEAGYARIDNDAYFTPRWCTQRLLDAVELRGPVWEPACGDGAIVRVLEANGYQVTASDLVDHGLESAITPSDFLAGPVSPWPGTIITNPPYRDGLDEAFVRRALEATERLGGMVAMLLRQEWDCAGHRRDLFKRPSFAAKLTLTKRPHWTSQRRASPRHYFAWFLWDWRHRGPSKQDWL